MDNEEKEKIIDIICNIYFVLLGLFLLGGIIADYMIFYR